VLGTTSTSLGQRVEHQPFGALDLSELGVQQRPRELGGGGPPVSVRVGAMAEHGVPDRVGARIGVAGEPGGDRLRERGGRIGGRRRRVGGRHVGGGRVGGCPTGTDTGPSGQRGEIGRRERIGRGVEVADRHPGRRPHERCLACRYGGPRVLEHREGSVRIAGTERGIGLGERELRRVDAGLVGEHHPSQRGDRIERCELGRRAGVHVAGGLAAVVRRGEHGREVGGVHTAVVARQHVDDGGATSAGRDRTDRLGDPVEQGDRARLGFVEQSFDHERLDGAAGTVDECVDPVGREPVGEQFGGVTDRRVEHRQPCGHLVQQRAVELDRREQVAPAGRERHPAFGLGSRQPGRGADLGRCAGTQRQRCVGTPGGQLCQCERSGGRHAPAVEQHDGTAVGARFGELGERLASGPLCLGHHEHLLGSGRCEVAHASGAPHHDGADVEPTQRGADRVEHQLLGPAGVGHGDHGTRPRRDRVGDRGAEGREARTGVGRTRRRRRGRTAGHVADARARGRPVGSAGSARWQVRVRCAW
jgi:hypothetical protein